MSGPITVTANAVTSNALPIRIVLQRAVPVGNRIAQASLHGDPHKIAVRPAGDYAYVTTSAGITAVNVDPASSEFMHTRAIDIPGGCTAVAQLPAYPTACLLANQVVPAGYWDWQISVHRRTSSRPQSVQIP